MPEAAPHLVGREREQEILRERLADTIAGRGSLVLIAGSAGIGKTALVAALAREAAGRRALILTGRCYETIQPPPYSLWLDLFEYYSVTASPTPPAPFATPGVLGVIANPAALTGQMRDWLLALSAQPLVLVCEDLHWADSASLDLLRTLTRTLPRVPVLVVATYREEELGREHPLTVLLPRLMRETNAMGLTLHPLSAADIRTLIVARYQLPEPEALRLARHLYDRAAGNAFFSIELLRALEERRVLRPGAGGWTVEDLIATPIPPLLRQMIDERVRRIGENGRELLDAAAVIGGDVPLAVWIHACAQDAQTVLDLIDRAVHAHLLTVEENGMVVRFAHALTRETLYSAIPLSSRRHLHRRIAEALIAQPDANPGTVAAHFRAAGDPRTLDWLIRAADYAQEAYAFKSMTAYLEAALVLLAAEAGTEITRIVLNMRIAHVGRYGPWTLSYLHEALRLATESNNAALIALAEIGIGFATMILATDARAILNTQAQALAILKAVALEETHDERYRTVICDTLPMWQEDYAQLVAVVGNTARVLHLLNIPPGQAFPDAPFADACGYNALGVVHALRGHVGEARVTFANATAWYLAFEQFGSAASVYEWELNELALICETDDHHRLTTLAALSEQMYRRDEAMPEVFPAQIARVGLLALTGEWDEALALVERMRTLLGFSGWYGMYLHLVGELAWARGDRVTAEAIVYALFPGGATTAPGGVLLRDALCVQRLAATLALESGDVPRARAFLEAHDRWLAWSGAVIGEADGWLAWAQYHRAIGERATAEADAMHALTLASAPRQPLVLLATHRFLGELATDAMQFSDARTYLDAALALADACHAPYERALTLIALAALDRVRGASETDGDAALAEAHGICTRLGARPTLKRIAGYSHVPRTDLTVRDTTLGVRLTKREHEILVLLAAGGTNTVIADALSLSVRTVERHISNLYAKIGVHSRADALVFAARHGLGPTPLA